ncbi:U-box domain-containing protein 62-like isoform X9 [Panicum virgatum]|uniref:U-box domain-containing protein 62-like isoform X9 n=1 Tax=Panicum virgatum TaxID=38727 RepID=UPI0019D64D17|nr:U-box domain-containing protein 62-like isoform X9 [Panicum virgatum]
MIIGACPLGTLTLSIARAVMNGDNGARHIQEGHQWQQQSHLFNRGTEQYGCTSSGGDEPGTIPREMRVENGYGVTGRREGGPASSYWDLLRSHLSDPLTGVLMDDAMILSCGHSYGSGGMQHIYRMKACGKCGQPITEDSIRPNLALRLAVQAFKREEDSAKTLKRRRERLEQVYTFFPVYQLCFKFLQLYVLHALKSIYTLCEDKCGNDDPNPTEPSRGKGVQFPFSVFDRVVIKGNKRTPERFVGCQAVVTAQCLNGCRYVVKTLDNAESVKLQYRSLAKVANGNGSPTMASSNAQNASWL